MSNLGNPKTNPDQPMVYEVRIKGHLGSQWADWFGDFTITRKDNGDTVLTGLVVDQSALHGLLKKVRDLGLPLCAVNCVEPVSTAALVVNETQQDYSKGSKNMNTGTKIIGTSDRRVVLSTLWIVVMLNMIFADIFSFMNTGFLQELMTTGRAEEIEITPVFLLIAALMTEIPIMMVFLSRVLTYRVNRLFNIVAAVITIAYVIGGGSTTLHYVFIATVEIVCMVFIIWYAGKWRNSES